MRDKVQTIYSLELLSVKDTAVRRLHPAAKLLSALCFIIIVISFDRYAVSRLVPFLFVPCIAMAFAEIPVSLLVKRVAVPLPFCLLAGLSNVFFDRATAFTLGSLSVSYGVLSLVSLIFRTALCVSAVLILIASTPLFELTMQMKRFHVPSIFVTTFEMTYRYIGLLVNETWEMRTAYRLRKMDGKGVDIRHAGSFAGHLLLRSMDRAERIYSAMKCRGYSFQRTETGKRTLSEIDWCCLVGLCGFCALLRLFNTPDFFAHLIDGVLQ